MCNSEQLRAEAENNNIQGNHQLHITEVELKRITNAYHLLSDRLNTGHGEKITFD